MISRRTTDYLGEIYQYAFTVGGDFLQLEIDRQLYDFFYRRDYEDDVLDKVKSISKPEQLKQFIQDFQRINGEVEQKYLLKMAADIIEGYGEVPNSNGLSEWIDTFQSQLELEGYIYRSGKLLPIENSVINQQTEQTFLEVLIDSLSLADPIVIKNHLILSEEHYANEKWGDCISNSRNVFEAILRQIADAINIKKNGSSLAHNIASRPVEVRKFLEQESFFDNKETKTIAEVYGLLSNTGSHPNISNENQARLMRNLALAFSQYALLNYEGFLKNNP